MNWVCRDCKKTIVGYKPEHCPGCHETFGGTRAGDLHRAGRHGVAVTGWPWALTAVGA